jgi:hypothetical protein
MNKYKLVPWFKQANEGKKKKHDECQSRSKRKDKEKTRSLDAKNIQTIATSIINYSGCCTTASRLCTPQSMVFFILVGKYLTSTVINKPD